MTVICAWCDKVLKAGKAGKVSHGICPKCFDLEVQKLPKTEEGCIPYNAVDQRTVCERQGTS